MRDPFTQRTEGHGDGITVRRRRRGLVLFQMRQHIVPLDAAIAAGAADQGNVYYMLRNELTHHGR